MGVGGDRREHSVNGLWGLEVQILREVEPGNSNLLNK